MIKRLKELKTFLTISKRKILLYSAGVFSVFLAVELLFSLFTARITENEPSLLLEDRFHRFIAAFENSDGQFGYWPLPDTLPQKIVALTKAAEDRRFDSHFGVDFRAIARAVHSNFVSRQSFSGASTVAMQVSRMQYGNHHRSYLRKATEALNALWLTLFHGRDAVLRQYLTIAPYGNRIAGINYAARRYFQKPLADLSYAEAALLTALPNAPGRMNLYRYSGRRRAADRAETILNRAHSYGWISPEDYREALEELPHVTVPSKELRQEDMIHALLMAQKQLVERDSPLELNPLNPTFRTTLDKSLQTQVQEIAIKHMNRLREYAADNCAVIVMERATGEVHAYIGSELYFSELNAGLIDYASTPRSTGSLLKPFIFGYGMEWNGYTPATLLTDIDLFFGDGNRTFVPRNYDGKFLGPVLYKTALANSRNIPAIQVLKDVGLGLVYSKLRELGVADEKGADHYGLGLAVGNLYSSLYDLCGGYLTLANEGRKVEPTWIYGKKQCADQVMDRDVAIQLQRILSDPIARLPGFPRGGALEYPYPVAVKTGTSRGFRDAWNIGWSDRWLVGVWIGRADNRPMKGVSGFSGAAPVVQEILNYLHEDRQEGLSNTSFSPPKGYEPVMVNIFTGEKAGKNSAFATMEYFKPGTEPTEEGNLYRWIPIDKRNGKLASPWCDEQVVEMQKFVVLPDIFKDWAAVQGLPVPPTELSTLCGGSRIVEEYKLSILAPLDSATIYIDPEMPPSFNKLKLNCAVKPKADEVLWVVDGQEIGIAKYPYAMNWQIEPGVHSFQVKIPGTQCMSRPVEILVY